MFKCLCCDQMITRPGEPMTPERAERAWWFLSKMGYTRERLLREHRDNLNFTAPGFVVWLESREEA
jgi:hypothetical protein